MIRGEVKSRMNKIKNVGRFLNGFFGTLNLFGEPLLYFFLLLTFFLASTSFVGVMALFRNRAVVGSHNYVFATNVLDWSVWGFPKLLAILGLIITIHFLSEAFKEVKK